MATNLVTDLMKSYTSTSLSSREYVLCEWCEATGQRLASWLFGEERTPYERCHYCLGSGLAIKYVDREEEELKMHDMMLLRLQFSYGFVVAQPSLFAVSVTI